MNNKILIIILAMCVLSITGCTSTKKVTLVDNQVKEVNRNVVTMDLETGDLK